MFGIDSETRYSNNLSDENLYGFCRLGLFKFGPKFEWPAKYLGQSGELFIFRRLSGLNFLLAAKEYMF